MATGTSLLSGSTFAVITDSISLKSSNNVAKEERDGLYYCVQNSIFIHFLISAFNCSQCCQVVSAV